MTERKINPKDVAASTAVGAATRLGTSRMRQAAEGDGAARGAAVGAGRQRRPTAGRSNVPTAIGVAVVMIGMLALMLYVGR